MLGKYCALTRRLINSTVLCSLKGLGAVLCNSIILCLGFYTEKREACRFATVLACVTGFWYYGEGQETGWVCRATGQESQDKGKETQMEVQGLKLSYIPKTQKTNIHQQGL